MNARRFSGEAPASLDASSSSAILAQPTQLVENLKEHGLIHRLSERSLVVPRDRRRARCGWPIGRSPARVRVVELRAWACAGSGRLCRRCFPANEVLFGAPTLQDDPIEDYPEPQPPLPRTESGQARGCDDKEDSQSGKKDEDAKGEGPQIGPLLALLKQPCDAA